MKYYWLLAGFLIAPFFSQAALSQSTLPQVDNSQIMTATVAASESMVLLEVFVRDGCPHCAAAKVYLTDFSEAHPEVHIQIHSLDQKSEARTTLQHYSRQAGIWPPGVPAFYSQGRLLVGFESAEVTGPKLHALVSDDTVPATANEIGPINKIGPIGPFDSLSVESLGLPLFTLALGLLDGFNPCAMWVLLFLLSLLVHVKIRVRMVLIAGTFVLVSGVIYYLFMVAWLNMFLVIGLTDYVKVLLAVFALCVGYVHIKDFFKRNQSIFLSIPEAAKPGLYSRMRNVVQAKSLTFSLLSAAALAIVVNFFELLCTAGFPAMYTAILTQQGLNPAGYYAYISLYIAAYMADDSLMVAIAVIALSSRKLTENTGRWLKLLSGVVMCLLGLVIFLKPDWVF